MARQVSLFVDSENLTLTQNAEWLSNGVPVSHTGQIQAFFKSLSKENGEYFLKIGKDKKKVKVEDTAFFVKRLTGSPQKGFQIKLTDGTTETLNPKTLLYSPGRLVCRVKDASEEARFLRGPYHELLQYLEQDPSGYFIEIQGERITLDS